MAVHHHRYSRIRICAHVLLDQPTQEVCIASEIDNLVLYDTIYFGIFVNAMRRASPTRDFGLVTPQLRACLVFQSHRYDRRK